MSQKFEARKAAGALNRIHDVPVMVAAAIDDREGGVFIQLGFADMKRGEAEFVVVTVLQYLVALGEAAGSCSCEQCAGRTARAKAALALLAAEGVAPTGKTRGTEH